MDDVVKKAKRRISRYIKTGKHQARVYRTSNPRVFEYKLKHYVESLFFKRMRFTGRLKQI